MPAVHNRYAASSDVSLAYSNYISPDAGAYASRHSHTRSLPPCHLRPGSLRFFPTIPNSGIDSLTRAHYRDNMASLTLCPEAIGRC